MRRLRRLCVADWSDHEGEFERQSGITWGDFDGTLQDRLDAEYGEGVVRVSSALVPLL